MRRLTTTHARNILANCYVLHKILVFLSSLHLLISSLRLDTLLGWFTLLESRVLDSFHVVTFSLFTDPVIGAFERSVKFFKFWLLRHDFLPSVIETLLREERVSCRSIHLLLIADLFSTSRTQGHAHLRQVMLQFLVWLRIFLTLIQIQFGWRSFVMESFFRIRQGLLKLQVRFAQVAHKRSGVCIRNTRFVGSRELKRRVQTLLIINIGSLIVVLDNHIGSLDQLFVLSYHRDRFIINALNSCRSV